MLSTSCGAVEAGAGAWVVELRARYELILYFFYKNMILPPSYWPPASIRLFYRPTHLYHPLQPRLHHPLLFRSALEQDVNYIYQKEVGLNNEPNFTCKSFIREKGYLPLQYSIKEDFSQLFPIYPSLARRNTSSTTRTFMLIPERASRRFSSLFCFYVMGEASLDTSGLSLEYSLPLNLRSSSSMILVATFKLSTLNHFRSGVPHLQTSWYSSPL